MTSAADPKQVALVVHEVRSPVAALAAILAATRTGPVDDASLRRLVDLSLAACRRIERIIGDAAPGSLQLAEVDVADLVRDAVGSARLGGARVRTELGSDVPHVVGDRVRLRRALDNLVDNAVSAAGAEGEIIVGVRATGHAVIVTVADDGSGLPTDDHARIFEPGVRLDSSSQGSGLGLAIVRAVAEAHGGSAAVVSAPGEGAVFSIALPIGGDQPAGTASSS
jgi:signal transduction histidine kinase